MMSTLPPGRGPASTGAVTWPQRPTRKTGTCHPQGGGHTSSAAPQTVDGESRLWRWLVARIRPVLWAACRSQYRGLKQFGEQMSFEVGALVDSSTGNRGG